MVGILEWGHKIERITVETRKIGEFSIFCEMKNDIELVRPPP